MINLLFSSISLATLYLSILAITECRKTHNFLNTGFCPPAYPRTALNFLDIVEWDTYIPSYADPFNSYMRSHFLYPCNEHLTAIFICIGAMIDLIALPTAAVVTTNALLARIGVRRPLALLLECFEFISKLFVAREAREAPRDEQANLQRLITESI